MNVDAQEVINALGAQVGELSVQLAIAKAQIKALTEGADESA